MTQKWIHRFQLRPGRWVFVPSDEGRKSGLRIKRAVESLWTPPDFFFHLRAGGHLAAVQVHADSRYFCRADLNNFFGRVNRSRITRCLKSWLPYTEAREMASESVVKNPAAQDFVLPYGFIQSPILASLALDKSRLGSYLRVLHRRPGVEVSVYVDDIIISGDDVGTLSDAVERLAQVAEASRFPINKAKTEGPAAEVTAFNIRVSQRSLRITEDRLESLRADYEATTSEFSKVGIRAYVKSVNPAQVF